MTEHELLDMIEPMRDPAIWEKGADGAWRAKDSVGNHVNDDGVEAARVPLRDNKCAVHPDAGEGLARTRRL